MDVKMKTVENALKEMLNSDAESKIYLFLSHTGGARSDEIATGTKLHPSTVRETLAKMHKKHLVHRRKIKNGLCGKKPYIYYATSPIKILQNYAKKMEKRFNRVASLQRINNIKVEVRIVRET